MPLLLFFLLITTVVLHRLLGVHKDIFVSFVILRAKLARRMG
jgi:hypothetical protein